MLFANDNNDNKYVSFLEYAPVQWEGWTLIHFRSFMPSSGSCRTVSVSFVSLFRNCLSLHKQYTIKYMCHKTEARRKSTASLKIYEIYYSYSKNHKQPVNTNL